MSRGFGRGGKGVLEDLQLFGLDGGSGAPPLVPALEEGGQEAVLCKSGDEVLNLPILFYGPNPC